MLLKKLLWFGIDINGVGCVVVIDDVVMSIDVIKYFMVCFFI